MSILGIIAGIIGVIGSGWSLVDVMLMPAYMSSTPLIFSTIAIALTITGLVAATLKSKKVSGILMIVSSSGGALTSITALEAKSATPIYFLIGIITFILFLISGIITLVKKA